VENGPELPKVIYRTRMGELLYEPHDHPENERLSKFGMDEARDFYADGFVKARDELKKIKDRSSPEYKKAFDLMNYHHRGFGHFHNKLRALEKLENPKKSPKR